MFFEAANCVAACNDPNSEMTSRMVSLIHSLLGRPSLLTNRSVAGIVVAGIVVPNLQQILNSATRVGWSVTDVLSLES